MPGVVSGRGGEADHVSTGEGDAGPPAEPVVQRGGRLLRGAHAPEGGEPEGPAGLLGVRHVAALPAQEVIFVGTSASS